MPCSICGQSGHNARTCDDVSHLSNHQRADEPVNQLNQSSINIVEPVINDITFDYQHIRNPTSRSPSRSPPRSPPRYEIYSPIPHIISGYNTPTEITVSSTDFASLFTPSDILPIQLFPDIDILPTQLFPDDDDIPPLQLLPDDVIITGLGRATNIIHPNPVIKTLVQIVDTPCHIDECPICMEDLLSTDTFTTRCGHMFHGTCMLIHTKLHDSCPLCRGVLIN